MQRTSTRTLGSLIGLLTAALAIAVAHLVAAFVDEAASPIAAVGAAVIDLAPSGVKEFAIEMFGTSDKLALVIGISVLLAGFAAGLGAAAVRRPWVSYAALCGFGAVGVAAAMTRPAAGTLAPVPTVVGVAFGLMATRLLFATTEAGPSRTEPADVDRRRFLLGSAAVGGAAVLAGIGSTFAGAGTRRAVASRAALRVPTPSVAPPSPTPAVATDLKIAGLTPYRTPIDDFYRIDTALIVPKIEADGWRLRIHGMVDREIELSLDELLARPLVERDVTLACVSNEIGDNLIGNATWTGVLIKPLLEEAGIHDGADQLLSRSSDGFTAGTPLAVLMDGRDAMLAVTMNGEPLPLKHGFPVRMVVPGLYGYVSATKWLVDMKVTTFDADEGYWIPRGWARRAPIKTMSRIDTPGHGRRLAEGTVPIAGVAWAQRKGIERVEVRIDDGPWVPAQLAGEHSIDTWRQWVYRWDATRGQHTIAVRATDKTGYTQTSRERPPIPDGATGWHSVDVTVA